MDVGIIFSSLFDFLKLLLLASFFSFILYKFFSPIRQRIEDKYSLSWVKSCLVLNFSVSFILLVFLFLHFMFIGFFNAPLRDPALEFDFVENILLFLIAVPRLAITSIVLTSFLLLFELVASFFMDKKKSFFSEIKGVVISSALFLVLFLFIFDWAPLGLFIFVFYGYLKPLPLIFLL